MKLNLDNRNYLSELIGYVKKEGISFYCILPVEYYVGEYWEGYVNSDNIDLETKYFSFLKQFEVNYFDLQKAYQQLIENSDESKLIGNTPKIYIDFDRKHFVSYFQEQELERRLPNGWKGEFSKVGELIPDNMKYWLPFESKWI